jgi:hypothetical protein
VRVRGMSVDMKRKSVKEGRAHIQRHYGRRIVGVWELQKVGKSMWVRGRGHGHSECEAPWWGWGG